MSDSKIPNSLALEFYGKLNREAKNICHQFTVAIFTVQFEKLKQCGSGVLICIGNHHFLVTAAHTIDAHFQMGLPILISNEVKKARLFNIRSHVLISKTNDPHDRSDDPIDICVCDLNEDAVSFLRENKKFATLLDIDTNDHKLPNNHYMTFGFPTELNPVDFDGGIYKTNPIAFSSFQYLKELHNFHSDRQIALSYFDGVTIDDEGSHVYPPHPSGMSGGGIWRVHDERVRWDKWSSDQIKLVAIEHTLKDNKALVGTSINLAMGFIIRAFPDLESVFDLHRTGLHNAKRGLLNGLS